MFLDDRFRHVARNSSWSIATTAVVAGAFFAETVLLARHFGRTTFGVYLLVIAYPEAVQMFLGFRTREAMTRYLGGFLATNKQPEAVAVVKLLWIVDLCVVTCAFVIVFLTAPLLAPHLTDDPTSTTLMRVFGIAMVLGGLVATGGSVLRVFDRFRLSFLTGSSAMLVRLLIVVSLVASGSGLEGIIWGRVLAELGGALLVGSTAFVLLKGALWSQRAASFRVLTGQYREILHFLFHMNLQGSLRAAASKLDVLAIGALTGPGTASLYKVGVQFGSSLLLFADPLFAAIYPMFARLGALGDRLQIRAIGRRLSVVLTAVALPTALLLAIESRGILAFLVGDAFVGARVPMVLVLVGVVPSVVFFWGRAAMLAVGDAQTATTITAVAVLVQFAVLLVLALPYGARGAAGAFAIMHLATVGMTLRVLRQRELI